MGPAMKVQSALLVLHIVLAILLLGPLVSYGFVLPSLIRKGPSMGQALATIEKVQSPLEKATGSILVVGIILVLHSHKEYSFKDHWISASLALFVVAAGLGMGVIAPTFRKAVEKLNAGDTATAEASRLQLVMYLNFAILVAILWLMVEKPAL